MDGAEEVPAAEGKVRLQLRTVAGSRPKRDAVRNAVGRVAALSKKDGFSAKLKYGNCGGKPVLSDAQQAAVVDFVKKWRAKRFCTCRCIIRELKFPNACCTRA